MALNAIQRAEDPGATRTGGDSSSQTHFSGRSSRKSPCSPLPPTIPSRMGASSCSSRALPIWSRSSGYQCSSEAGKQAVADAAVPRTSHFDVVSASSVEVGGTDVAPKLAPVVCVGDGQNDVAAPLASDDFHADGVEATLSRLLDHQSRWVGMDLSPRPVLLNSTLTRRLPLAVIPGHGRRADVGDGDASFGGRPDETNADGLSVVPVSPLVDSVTKGRSDGVDHARAQSTRAHLLVLLQEALKSSTPFVREPRSGELLNVRRAAATVQGSTAVCSYRTARAQPRLLLLKSQAGVVQLHVQTDRLERRQSWGEPPGTTRDCQPRVVQSP